ncbi:metal ABC transporter ATP-binding protein [Filibacter tadaridae]|uniref:High-affinity zinc uptake system ATP-binding protein ZnuC n=1 Tax=Filibacter tadaridae TaxID=2483811 RepID=A0A3P5XWC6_9BACL|nr:metal ABC transporter ATP-binding protein [Filibacter tadaridae]VDC32447.1 High-affinity zinc uptake system ATP-binding protein ZnuC [Filibacter tadaridae]
MTNHIIQLDDVSFSYDHSIVLDHIHLEVGEGEFWALIGPNGSGKSTLINIILGLLKPSSGSVELFGSDINSFKHRERIGYVSQKSNSFNSGFPATVLEVVRSGLTRKSGLFRSFSKKDEQKALKSLGIVGMESFARQNIGELSGGQQQRVFIARALVGEPDLLIMDEPTVGIDQQNVASFYSMLNELNRDHGIAIVLVTHEIDLVTDLATHVACLNRSIHFHGIQSDYKKMDDEDISNWYGHPVRRVHQFETEVDQ